MNYVHLKGRKIANTIRRTVIGVEPDRISCLPGHVIDQILSYLPIREAVKTSVLSSEWRNKWHTLPNIVFDLNCVSNIEAIKDPSIFMSKLLRIVDHVLLLHSGPINKFQLSDPGCDLSDVNSVADIDRWILRLTEKSIKEFVLQIFVAKKYYKIPQCLFSCQSLQNLKLDCCCIQPPTTFKGFKNLKSLELYQVTMAQDAFENLISGCHLLEDLKLLYLEGLTQLNIHAPNLKKFLIVGDFVDFSFDNTFQLTELGLFSFDSRSNHSQLRGCSSNLLRFFAHLPHIESLVISSQFLKYLDAGDVPVKLPTPCINLSSLFICIRFNDLKQILAALCLLRSSPNLRRLEIAAKLEKHTDLLTPASYCWKDVFLEPPVPLRVRHVSIKGISDNTSELDFIRFLLMYSPMLEKMTVKLEINVTPELMTKIIQFKRASEQAEVIYQENDSS
ncbi:putative F-box domain, leucine-rich repeat domain, L domain-containing protein [Medicago truncatula]|uniref:Putative F-box domain, leucine-rich repeat domain, L domain-containing protein n=1 Tax=Medicago truncatula TaxID=3880 RepID=A0A396JFM7_MEDTR|nr:putative F-box domain, leucine-rich repeat domain, L domain-containing protein [Medicago truncatula]